LIHETISPVYLATFGLRREPPRPKKDREPGYEDRFDFNTLFFDFFLSEDSREIIAIGPPLFNCEQTVKAGTFRLEPGGPALQVESSNRDYGGIFRLAVPNGALPQSLTLEISGRSVTVPIHPSGCDVFRNRNVIFGWSKNNPLPWIKDWATYNVRVHGADAVILYDNIRQTLSEVDGLEAILVSSWPFPHGTGLGPNMEWDSNYSQNCALQHARWRFCADARGLLNSDIDELVVSKTGESVFGWLEASGEQCLTYPGRWVSVVRPRLRKNASLIQYRTGADIRHSDCLYLENEPLYPNKWVASPRRCGNEVDFRTHTVHGLSGSAAQASERGNPTTKDFEFRHCRQVSTNWKYGRHWTPVYRPGAHTYDHLFARTLVHAFPDRAIFRQSGGPLGRLWDLVSQF
jgi:hypothetical protein